MNDGVKGLREVDEGSNAGLLGVQRGDNIIQDPQCSCGAPMAWPESRLQVGQDVIGGQKVAELFMN